MAIAFSNLGVSAAPDFNNAVPATSYATASWAPPTADLIFLFVLNDFVGTPNTPTVSGNSITWTQAATFSFAGGGDTLRWTLFGANGAGSSTGATTVDFAAQTQIACAALFAAATGVDLTGGVAAAFVASATNDGNSTTGTVTLAAASHSDNRPIVAFHPAAGGAVTPRANWTELDENSWGSESQYRGDTFETTASATFTSGFWGGIAAELKATLAGTGFQ